MDFLMILAILLGSISFYGIMRVVLVSFFMKTPLHHFRFLNRTLILNNLSEPLLIHYNDKTYYVPEKYTFSTWMNQATVQKNDYSNGQANLGTLHNSLFCPLSDYCIWNSNIPIDPDEGDLCLSTNARKIIVTNGKHGIDDDEINDCWCQNHVNKFGKKPIYLVYWEHKQLCLGISEVHMTGLMKI
jgi:hypothetical protein